MSNQRRQILLLAAVVLGAVTAMPGSAERREATPEEIVSKVRRAADLLSREGEAGLDVIRDPSSEFAWKDTYVFVVDCNADRVMANPAFPARVGGDIKKHTDFDGKRYGLELCAVALAGGGWVEYVWPRRGSDVPARKVSFVVPVEGRPYQVGAGVYDEEISVDELHRLESELEATPGASGR